MATPKKSPEPGKSANDSQADREYRQALEAGEAAAKVVQGWAQPIKPERRTDGHLPVDQQRAK